MNMNFTLFVVLLCVGAINAQFNCPTKWGGFLQNCLNSKFVKKDGTCRNNHGVVDLDRFWKCYGMVSKKHVQSCFAEVPPAFLGGICSDVTCIGNSRCDFDRQGKLGKQILSLPENIGVEEPQNLAGGEDESEGRSGAVYAGVGVGAAALLTAGFVGFKKFGRKDTDSDQIEQASYVHDKDAMVVNQL